MNKLLYLAGPYSNDPVGNYALHQEFAAELLLRNFLVVSPIIQCHELAGRYGMPVDYIFWRQYNHALIDKSDGLVVMKVPGWQDSAGTQGEIGYAETHQIPWYLTALTDIPRLSNNMF